jgi:DNA repair exonuclease SbcCD ATPase subunit
VPAPERPPLDDPAPLDPPLLVPPVGPSPPVPSEFSSPESEQPMRSATPKTMSARILRISILRQNQRGGVGSAMAPKAKDAPELVHAAETLENELASLEALSGTVQRIRLDSEKNIAKAARELAEALELPERLAQGLAALAAAMQHMQARQNAALEPLAARASHIQERKRRLDAHMERFAALGRVAGDASQLLQAGAKDQLVVGDVRAKLASLGDDAKTLFDAARADDFPDVAREADALAKRVTALLRRLDGVAN